MYVAQGGRNPESILYIKQDDSMGNRRPETKKRGNDRSATNPIATVHYKPTVSKEDQMDNHGAVQTNNVANLRKDRQRIVNLPSVYDWYK